MNTWRILSTTLLPGSNQVPPVGPTQESDKKEEEELGLWHLQQMARLLGGLLQDAHVDVFPGAKYPSSDNSLHGSSPSLLNVRTFRADWRRQGLTSDLLGPDVNEDNFAERMVALIAERRRAFATQRSTIPKHRRALKKRGEDLEHDVSKKPKPTEVPMGQYLWHGRKFLEPGKKSSYCIGLGAEERTFIRVLSDDDSDDDDDPVIFWEILHLVDRQDLLKLYGMVVKYYEDHPLAGAGMMLWGDLQVLFESHEGGHGSLVWSDQQQWHIRSWRLFLFSNVHVLETISGKVVYMFADGSYPLSVQLMKKMLKHKLEIEIDGVGNDMTYAEKLIQFIKNQIAASIPSA
ncbi:hypothetical protein Tco_0940452 [Tanacetum coccineum]|uniref:Aminoacyl-tRNA synthetase, class 1a, anticodon-binding n=1 Tax=Tanacetum coccineum TaxID=301880 RepID=A0ABQ5DNE4_9ASTR